MHKHSDDTQYWMYTTDMHARVIRLRAVVGRRLIDITAHVQGVSMCLKPIFSPTYLSSVPDRCIRPWYAEDVEQNQGYGTTPLAVPEAAYPPPWPSCHRGWNCRRTEETPWYKGLTVYFIIGIIPMFFLAYTITFKYRHHPVVAYVRTILGVYIRFMLHGLCIWQSTTSHPVCFWTRTVLLCWHGYRVPLHTCFIECSFVLGLFVECVRLYVS